jgi:hypothetical protein
MNVNRFRLAVASDFDFHVSCLQKLDVCTISANVAAIHSSPCETTKPFVEKKLKTTVTRQSTKTKKFLSSVVNYTFVGGK